MLILLLENPSDDSVEMAVDFCKEVRVYMCVYTSTRPAAGCGVEVHGRVEEVNWLRRLAWPGPPQGVRSRMYRVRACRTRMPPLPRRNSTLCAEELCSGMPAACLQVGAHLQDVAPAGLHSVFERFRAILHEGAIDKRCQYMIEGLFAVRKVGWWVFLGGGERCS